MKIIQDLDKTFQLENQNNFANAQKDNNQQRAKETGSSDMKKSYLAKGVLGDLLCATPKNHQNNEPLFKIKTSLGGLLVRKTTIGLKRAVVFQNHMA